MVNPPLAAFPKSVRIPLPPLLKTSLILSNNLRALCTLVVSALTLAFTVRASATEPPVEDPVVMLSPYEVSARSVAFEHWVKYRSPHFVIYSDASPKDVEHALSQFEQLYLAAVKYFDRPAFKRAPTLIVLPSERSDWRKLESTIAVEWRVAVSQPTRRLQALVLVGYDWQGWLNGGDNVLLSALGSAQLTEMKIEGPLWFSRGVGRFFETAQFEDDAVILGKLSARARSLWRHGWLPWPVLFKVTSTSPEYTKKDGIKSFTGQSAAFVHYLLTQRDRVWRERLMTWTAMLNAGQDPTEEAFKSVFGQDWITWQTTMKAHVSDRRDKTAKIELTAAERNFPVTKVDLPPAEMRELFVLSQILNQRKPASETALDSLLAKGLKTEALRELLAEACVKWKRATAAQEQLQTLITAGSENPMVYIARAEALLRARVPVLNLNASLDEGREEIRQLCEKALKLQPRHPDASSVLAWTEALGPSLNAENVVRIETLVSEQAGISSNEEIVMALAIAQNRTGQQAAARASAQAVVDSPFASKRAQQLASSLLRELGTPP